MIRYSWIALTVIAADQAVKQLVRGLNGPVTLLPGLLGLTYTENTGMAFSLFSGRPWLLGVLSLVLVIGGCVLVRRYSLSRLSQCAVMLMLGGAVGNMIDRFWHGYVVDMFEVLAFRFAVFNVADAALTIGCIITAYTLLFRKDDWREKKHGRTEGNDL